MNTNLLHVYRNTSMGRETYLHSLYFCKMLNIGLTVYIPATTHFSMNLDNETIRIDLDESYLTSPESAVGRVKGLAESNRIAVTIFSPKLSPNSRLPGLHKDFSFMTCPRSISDLSSKIGLGFIGTKVRQIVHTASFPVLITSPVFKPWENVTVLFGGSDSSINAVRLGIHMAKRTGLPLNLLTYLEEERSFYQNAIDAGGVTQAVKQSVACLNAIDAGGVTQAVKQSVACWHQFGTGRFEDHLYAVPHNSLVIVGAYGHGKIKELLFGSKLEKIQATLTNNLLIAGPRVRIPQGFHHVPAPAVEPGIVGVVTSIEPASLGGQA